MVSEQAEIKSQKAPVKSRRKGLSPRIIYTRVLKKKQNAHCLKSATVHDVNDIFATCVRAAFAKCIDFNVALNASNVRSTDAFFYMSGMRSVCEDLIVLRFLSGRPEIERREYLSALTSKNLSEGLLAQYRFFQRNNPLQPLIGGRNGKMDAAATEGKLKSNLSEAKARLKVAGNAVGMGAKLNVADVASRVGLQSTYQFIYFLSSNFVHFNPSMLLKLGWSEKADRDFEFSAAHMSTYYGATAILYASILFIGFANFLSHIPEFKAADFDDETRELEHFIGQIHRWPEIVTFEEMNVRPPPFGLLHAMREVMRSEGQTEYGQILTELKSAFAL